MSGESARVVAYQVGGWYQQQDGEWVQLLGVSSPGSHYECMYSIDEAGNRIHRYTNRPGDYGRVTGSPHDYSDPRNIPPLVPESALAELRVERDELQSCFDGQQELIATLYSEQQTLISGLEALAGDMKNSLGHDEHGSYISEQTIVEWAERLSTLASAGLEGKD